MITNQYLNALIQKLKKHGWTEKADIWRRIAADLEKSNRSRRVVNLSRLNRYSSPNEVVIVPGKVLGSGSIGHSVVVAAFAFSDTAKDEIKKAKGTCMTIDELMSKNPKGKDVRIIG